MRGGGPASKSSAFEWVCKENELFLCQEAVCTMIQVTVDSYDLELIFKQILQLIFKCLVPYLVAGGLAGAWPVISDDTQTKYGHSNSSH